MSLFPDLQRNFEVASKQIVNRSTRLSLVDYQLIENKCERSNYFSIDLQISNTKQNHIFHKTLV